MALSIPEGSFAGYIFDCDGTLVNSMPLHLEAWNHGIRAAGVDGALTEEYFYASGGKALRLVLSELSEQYGWKLDPDTVHHHKEEYFMDRAKNLRAFEDVSHYLREARKRRLPVAVASGSVRPTVESTLEAAGLLDDLDIIVTAEDVLHGKPAPDCFLLAAEKMGVSPESCLVFEDGEAGLIAARAAGMQVVRVDARRPH